MRELGVLDPRLLHEFELPPDVRVEAKKIEAIFPLLPEAPSIFPLWRNLVDTYGVIGRQVYDTRLVAVMQAHGLTKLASNDPDFDRVPALTRYAPA